MIAGVKDPSKDPQEQGYLALRQAADGTWWPIHGHPVPSSDHAIAECITDICNRVHECEELVSERMQMIESEIARLLQSPTSQDRVCIQAVVCDVDNDGAVILSSPLVDSGPPWPAIDVVIDDVLYEALYQSMELKDVEHTEAVRMIIDAVLNEPLDLLVATAARRPDVLDQTARLMVQVSRQQASHGRGEDPPSQAPEPR